MPVAKLSSKPTDLKQERKAALLRRYKSGSRLSKEQLDEIRDQLPDSISAPESTSAFARTQDELAKRIGITRRTISNHIKDEGAPATAADGRYDVAAWSAFICDRGIIDDPESEQPKNWKHELDRLKCAEIELRMEQERRDLVPIGEVLAAAGRTISAFRTALNQLPGRCAQGIVRLRGFDDIKDFLESEVRIILSGLQEGSFLDEEPEVIGELEQQPDPSEADETVIAEGTVLEAPAKRKRSHKAKPKPKRSSITPKIGLSPKGIKRTPAKKKRARK